MQWETNEQKTKCSEWELTISVQLAVTHHVGNYVATSRGPNPPKILESMPIYVRLGMHLLYVGKEQEKLLGTTKINEVRLLLCGSDPG